MSKNNFINEQDVMWMHWWDIPLLYMKLQSPKISISCFFSWNMVLTFMPEIMRGWDLLIWSRGRLVQPRHFLSFGRVCWIPQYFTNRIIILNINDSLLHVIGVENLLTDQRSSTKVMVILDTCILKQFSILSQN